MYRRPMDVPGTIGAVALILFIALPVAMLLATGILFLITLIP